MRSALKAQSTQSKIAAERNHCAMETKPLRNETTIIAQWKVYTDRQKLKREENCTETMAQRNQNHCAAEVYTDSIQIAPR